VEKVHHEKVDQPVDISDIACSAEKQQPGKKTERQKPKASEKKTSFRKERKQREGGQNEKQCRKSVDFINYAQIEIRKLHPFQKDINSDNPPPSLDPHGENFGLFPDRQLLFPTAGNEADDQQNCKDRSIKGAIRSSVEAPRHAKEAYEREKAIAGKEKRQIAKLGNSPKSAPAIRGQPISAIPDQIEKNKKGDQYIGFPHERNTAKKAK